MIVDFAPTPVFFIIIGLVFGLVIGWVIGFFDSNKRTEKKITDAETKAHAMVAEAEKKIRKAEEEIARVSQGGAPAAGDSLLRMYVEDGRTKIELDGAPLAGAITVGQKKRLIETLARLRPWLEGGTPQPVAAPPPKPAPVPIQEAEAAPPAKKPEPEKDFASLSIVQQIDRVLQARLAGTPLEGKGIRLQESPQGAVEVFVGSQKFLSVEDVSNDVIRSAIRAAITEWEEKYTPGL